MKNLIILMALSCAMHATGQTADLQLIGSLGGDFSDTNIDVNYSAGEAVIQTISNVNVSVTQGFHQSIDFIGGLNELNIGDDLSLFPNPVSSTLNVEFSENASTSGYLEVFIFNANGQIVYSEASDVLQGNDGMIQLDLSALETGHYIIQIEDANGTANRANFVKL